MDLLLNLVFWLDTPMCQWTLTAIYLGLLAILCVYGAHRYWLVWLYLRHPRRPLRRARLQQLPPITVQLPMFNELQVAQRVIDAACHLDYPQQLLQIQVVDDSTDQTTQIAADRVRYWASRGVNIEYLHRKDRRGFKAGALAAALPRATGQFIAIFDADFIPPPRFLKRAIHHFADPQIGLVQGRWDHLNRDSSLLTRCQAIFLDGHFLIEHAARCQSGRWINFNGTAGIWRKKAIDDGGGWQHDTLTEDVDLSYRAQLAGWKFRFLPRLGCPAELPPEMIAFKSQQHRWTKGTLQTARKLLPTLLRAPIPMRVKTEAFFHLTGPVVNLCVTLMVLLFFPALFINMQPFESNTVAAVLLGSSLFALGTFSAGTFYIVSQRARRRPFWQTLSMLPVLMGVGVGIALNNARGCIEALTNQQSPFVRTPKYNVTSSRSSPLQAAGRRPVRFKPRRLLWPTLELAMGLYVLMCATASFSSSGLAIGLPFLLLFAAGYFYTGLSSLWVLLQPGLSSATEPEPAGQSLLESHVEV